MTDQILEEIKKELLLGAQEKSHPYRYFTLATVGVDHVVRQRTVVLRKLSDDLHLTFFTDYRSKKIMHIHENNMVSLLFYHGEKLLQLKIEGLAAINRDEEAVRKYWNSLKDASRRDYTTSEAPGSRIKSPDVLEYLEEDNHFCAVEVAPLRIEYLKLQRPNHLRVQFTKHGNLWESNWLVP